MATSVATKFHSARQVDRIPPIMSRALAEAPGLHGVDECWPWPGRRSRAGYGCVDVVVGGSKIGPAAHRLAYVLVVGDVPAGLTIDHICSRRECFNPTHLRIAPHRENLARGKGPQQAGVRARLETGRCPRGHDAWKRNPRKADTWTCDACDREHQKKYVAERLRARLALGLTHREYRQLFGYSRFTAASITRHVDAGVPVEDIIDLADYLVASRSDGWLWSGVLVPAA